MSGVSSADIRNIAIVGHGATGKTTLVDTILHKTGVNNRIGSVDDGSSLSDFDDEEKQRKFSISASNLHCTFNGKLLNIIDCPGYPDFVGEVVSAYQAAESAVVTISAANGVEVNTRKVWQYATDNNLSKFILITKMDAENINYDDLMGQIHKSFSAKCIPLNLPVGVSAQFSGVVSTLRKADTSVDNVLGDLDSTHEEVVESIVEVDDALLERYLEGGQVSDGELASALQKGIVEGKIVPIMFSSAKKDIGIEEFLTAVSGYCPNPTQRKMPPVTSEGGEEKELEISESAPLVARVFKVLSDPFVGKMSYVRIYSGTLTTESNIYNTASNQNVKISQFNTVQGKQLESIDKTSVGDIIAFSKVEELNIGDTICDEKEKVTLPSIDFPAPMVSLAVEPKSRADEQKINSALTKLANEDQTFVVKRDSQTNELVITGMSNLHLEVMLSKMKRRFGVEVITKQPKIPYLETINGKSEGHYKHKKQTGGRGQYGEVYIRLEPLERGTGFEFVDKIVGGAIPNQYIPAVEKGIREVLNNGIIAGYPVVDVRVELYDGTFHTVDSSEAAFKLAASKAFQGAFMNAKPVLLEPIVNIEVTIPSNFMGDVTGDLNSRRGRIMGMDSSANMQIIKAKIPLSEIASYATELRSMTGGTGSYSLEFSHYDVVPMKIQEQIISRSKKSEEES